jgi:hypothetical protein
MIILLCRNRVADFSKWKYVFDSHAEAHRDAGLRLKDLWRGVEDPNNIFFLFEVISIDKAQEFIKNPAAAEAGKMSGVLDGEYHFLESSTGYDAESQSLSEDKIEKIKAEVKQAADNHLHAKDAGQALNHFTKDVIAASNEKLFPSINELAQDVKEYYQILKKVNFAIWEEIYIHVINENLATFTAKFRYGFTNMENEKIDLKGIWTALYIRDNDNWKIRLRHESFSQY